MESSERETMGIVSTSSLLRSMGSLTKTSGRGLLMFRTLAVSATAAAVVGLCSAYVGGMLVMGGGHLFVIGSSLAWIGASSYYLHSQIRHAFAAFDDYPELMRLHLMMNFPLMRFQRMDLRSGSILRERARLANSWALTSMLASAYQTAAPSIDDILLRREQEIINNATLEVDSPETTGEEGDTKLGWQF